MGREELQVSEEPAPYAREQTWAQNCAACSCCLALMIVTGTSAGGFSVILKGGTEEERCTERGGEVHLEGEDKFRSVCIGGGTEAPFTGIYDKEYNASGVYRCACCGAPLFPALTKFNSGTGWPSFSAPVGGKVIGYSKDIPAQLSVEVHCHACGAHLGHVFDDGQGVTGYRYCINSVCLNFDRDLQMPADNDVPWVCNMYLGLALFVGGIVGTCVLAYRTPRYLMEGYRSRRGISPGDEVPAGASSACRTSTLSTSSGRLGSPAAYAQAAARVEKVSAAARDSDPERPDG
eukprot:gnl/TRDRNA2_/TRDRNA2_126392_c0_seq2.p1 gnl/TRDRNA2_/TRDRNA2_126392_c0~~gnl/TRDRNA2_/TRDRNA2_126392_c0_seq2.p1  ORF type:complete len:291 (-),score=36.33 gnl/TRDRNA2_/TRDRNA2_126392_c0_seq2:58-930(-)